MASMGDETIQCTPVTTTEAPVTPTIPTVTTISQTVNPPTPPVTTTETPSLKTKCKAAGYAYIGKKINNKTAKTAGKCAKRYCIYVYFEIKLRTFTLNLNFDFKF